MWWQCRDCARREHENPMMRCMKYGGLYPPMWTENFLVRSCDDQKPVGFKK